MRGDRWIEQFGADRPEPLEGPLLIGPINRE